MHLAQLSSSIYPRSLYFSKLHNPPTISPLTPNRFRLLKKLNVRMRKESVVDFDCFFVPLEEMVKHRRSSSRSSSSSARFVSMKAISIYLIFIFAFTIFSSRNIQTQHQQHQDPRKMNS
ncbi:PREDICTED: uncharacterized protein LOC106332425 isoform X2 [Brassica oleracea var. oleracea]|uniref:uncharacterized protein LOC106332425 isoform X2 n=1 Tax=Brassica oleracea var. oleracea TaxID=109376 RepID=UPI0006A6C93B|nr:PREDICTED: uncharacterized protein LOC106332425 isoform X2 [Brassica oleracea var. oleracea]